MGSNVVCSTSIGNARASNAWNRQQDVSRFSYVLMYGVFLYKQNGLTANQHLSFHQANSLDICSGVMSPTTPIPQSSQNGQSVENVPTPTSQNILTDTYLYNKERREDSLQHWYAARITFGRVHSVFNAIMSFEEGDVTPYLPVTKKKVYRMVNGKTSLTIENRPVHTGLLFVKATRSHYRSLLQASPRIPGLTPFYDHFSVSHTGRNDYLVVPDRQFDSFRRIIEADHEDILTDQNEVPAYLIGKRVRVTDGMFAGVEGTLLKWKHQRRVFVDLGLFGKYGTGYVRTCDFEVIDN